MKPTNLNPPTWGPFRPYQPLGLIAPTPNSCCGYLNWKTAGELGPNLAMDMIRWQPAKWKHQELRLQMPAFLADFSKHQGIFLETGPSHELKLLLENLAQGSSWGAIQFAKVKFLHGLMVDISDCKLKVGQPWPLVRNFCLVECLCWPVFFCRYCTYLESKSISLLQQGWPFFAYICDLSHK